MNTTSEPGLQPSFAASQNKGTLGDKSLRQLDLSNFTLICVVAGNSTYENESPRSKLRGI
jgi:hypothetical protein